MKLLFHKFRRLGSSLMARFLLLGGIMILLGLTLVSVTLFSIFQDKTNGDYRKLTQRTLSNVDTSFTYYLQNAKQLLTQWYQSPEGTLSRLDPDFTIPENMKLLRTVQKAFGTTPYVHSVYSIGTDYASRFSCASGTTNTPDLQEWIVNHLEARRDAAGMFCWSAPKLYHEQQDVPLLSLYYGEVAPGSRGFMGTMVLNVDLVRFSKTLFQDTESRLSFCVVSSDGFVAAHSNPDFCGQSWRDREMFQTIQSGQEEPFSVRDDGKSSDVYWISSSLPGWYIVCQSPSSQWLEQWIRIVRVFALILFGAALLMALLTFPLGRIALRPFRRLVAEVRKDAGAQEMEGGDISFLEGYYRQLSKDLAQLKQRNEQDFILKNLLARRNSQQIQDFLLENRILAPDRGYVLLIAGFGDPGGESRNLREYSILRETVSRIFCAQLETVSHCTCLEISLRQMLFILSESREHPSLDPSALAVTVQRTAGAAGSYTQVPVMCVMSGRADTGSELCADLFHEAESRMTTRVFLGAGGLGDPSRVSSEARIRSACDRVQEAMREDDFSVCQDRLEELLALQADRPWEDFRETMVSLMERVSQSRIHGDPGAGEGAGSAAKLREQFDEFSGRSDLLLWFSMMHHETATVRRKVENSSLKSRMADVVDYINSHYDDNALNVNILAERMHISVSYLSRLFRDFTGCTVLEIPDSGADGKGPGSSGCGAGPGYQPDRRGGRVQQPGVFRHRFQEVFRRHPLPAAGVSLRGKDIRKVPGCGRPSAGPVRREIRAVRAERMEKQHGKAAVCGKPLRTGRLFQPVPGAYAQPRHGHHLHGGQRSHGRGLYAGGLGPGGPGKALCPDPGHASGGCLAGLYRQSVYPRGLAGRAAGAGKALPVAGVPDGA